MKFKILSVFRFLLSIKSIITINTYIFFKKTFNKNIKIIFFYFPVKSYQDNILDLINELKKDENINVILAFNLGSSREVKNYDNAFFLNLGYLKYINNIDIFLSSYVVYEFPNSLNRVYIAHDIYDTPWVKPEIERDLFTTLNKYNHIFLPSDIAISDLQKKINKYTKNHFDNKQLRLINTGYLKLDHVYKKLKNNSATEDSILLAPTLSSMLENYNLNNFLESIIVELLKNSNFKVIYRPHPVDKNDKKNNFISNIYLKFKNDKNFFLDDNTSYMKSYARSKILITDFSGTAYTYAFSKLRPIIFFSKNEEELMKSNFKDLFYFKDRLNVGKIVKDFNNLNEEIHSIDGKIKVYEDKIRILRSERIKFFKNSIEQNLINLKRILNNKTSK